MVWPKKNALYGVAGGNSEQEEGPCNIFRLQGPGSYYAFSHFDQVAADTLNCFEL